MATIIFYNIVAKKYSLIAFKIGDSLLIYKERRKTMKLKTGLMTSQELSVWFGVSYTTYKHNVKKYLSKLEPYASFTQKRGGVIIEEVFIETYNKNLIRNLDKIFVDEVLNANDKLSTISGIARKYEIQMPEISERTLRRQFSASRDKLFGKTRPEENKTRGIVGSREYVWAIKINDHNKYRFLTPKEEELFDALIVSVYGKLDADKVKGAAMLEKMYRESDTMTKEEYFALRERNGYDFFNSVIKQFKEITGEQIVHANKYEVEWDFELPEDEQAYKIMLLSQE